MRRIKLPSSATDLTFEEPIYLVAVPSEVEGHFMIAAADVFDLQVAATLFALDVLVIADNE